MLNQKWINRIFGRELHFKGELSNISTERCNIPWLKDKKNKYQNRKHLIFYKVLNNAKISNQDTMTHAIILYFEVVVVYLLFKIRVQNDKMENKWKERKGIWIYALQD